MSWQMVNRGETMLADKFDFIFSSKPGFGVDWMINADLGICLDEARKTGAQLPVTEIVLEYYKEVAANGGNKI